MKGLIKNYVEKLTIKDLSDFALKNNIHLSNDELEYLLNLTKNHFEDMLVNEDKYLEEVKNNVNTEEFDKIKKLFLYYKNKYKGYLF